MCTQTIVVDFIPSIGKDIIAFSIPEQVGETTIDVAAKTIDLFMPIGTDVTELTPAFEISDDASSIPELGDAVDFTEPLTYIITAQDGSQQEWIVSVNVEEDMTPPTFMVKANSEDFVTELEIGDTYMVGEISNIIDESITVSEILGDDQVDTTQEGGPFLVTYTVSDGPNTTTITEAVNIVDSNQELFEITHFTLVNADTNEDLFLLEEGMLINIDSLPTLNLDLRANATDNTRSVSLALSGDKSTSRTENVFPYALYGDSPAGNYSGSEFGIGSYTVSAKPYAERQLEGDSGEELSLNFQIIEPQRPFVTTWKTDNPGTSDDNQIKIPTLPGATYNYTVDWGDGNSDSLVTGEIVHSYSTPGIYTIKLEGNFPVNFHTEKLLSIDQWGTYELGFIPNFGGCINMDILATDIPNLSNTTSVETMFANCRNLVGNSTIGNWDVSTIREFDSMFFGASSFNQNISKWNVSSGVDMEYMFNGASSFNQDISSWDVSAVNDFSGMFSGASSFNVNISGWVINAAYMGGMFNLATSFNQNLGNWNVQNVFDMEDMFNGTMLSNENYDSILQGWSTQQLQNEVIFDGGNSQYCLGEAARQKLINDFGWQITDGGKADNCDIVVEGIADLVAATYLQGFGNPSPTGTILRVEEGNRKTYLKFDMSAFNGPITEASLQMQVASDPGNGTLEVFLGSNSNWTETGLTGSNKPVAVGSALASISGTHSLGQTKTWNLDVSQLTSGGEITLIVKHSNGNDVAFASDETNQAPQLLITSGAVVQQPFITTWKTDNPGISADNQVTIRTFPGETYNYSINWGDGNSDTNVAGDIVHTYAVPGTYEIAITGNFPRIYSDGEADYEKLMLVNQWGNIKWGSMQQAFASCPNLEVVATDVPDLSAVTSMLNMFSNCDTLVGNRFFNNWDVSNVTGMYQMFAHSSFNSDISNWNVAKVTDMIGMFRNTSFNQNIGNWDVGNLKRMSLMFESNSSFNQDIGNWNVSKVIEMGSVFQFSRAFNQDLSRWDVSNVEYMGSMFSSASSFNQDLSSWNVSNVEYMRGMFSGAYSFDQNLSSWNIGNIIDMDFMFSGVKLSTTNYDATLSSWSTEQLQNGVIFGGGHSQYCQGEGARQNLIDNFGWIITDGGKSDDCVIVEASADLIEATYLQGSRNPEPTGPILRVEEGNREIYLKFDLSSFNGDITKAQLEMQVASDPGNGVLEVFLGSNSNWTESGLNGSNKPIAIGNAIASISGTHSLGQKKTWNMNVSQINGGGLITLIVKHSTGNDVAFASDETHFAPKLIVNSDVSEIGSGASISSKTSNILSLSPNPASMETTISLKEPSELVMIYIYDVLGRMVASYKGGAVENNESYALNVSNLTSGTYYIKTYDTQGNEYQKQIIIKK